MKKTFLTVLLFYIFTGIVAAQNLSKNNRIQYLIDRSLIRFSAKRLVRNRLSQTECRSH